MTPVRLLLCLPVVLLATVSVAMCWPSSQTHRAAAPVVTTDPAVEVLRDWDQRRAGAWASGDPAALEELYVDGSRSGRHDHILLQAYAGRGLVVRELSMQLLRVQVVVREEDRLVLVVTDRLARVEARHHGRRLPLPADLPSTHRVTLVRVGDTWLVDEVVPADQPAR